MDTLTEMAQELGKSAEDMRWKIEADDMYKLLIKRLWKNKQFIAIYVPIMHLVIDALN